MRIVKKSRVLLLETAEKPPFTRVFISKGINLPALGNWREEILNYSDYRITNGLVDGKNNRIKTIKRMAYGYRNMDNFRLRILAANQGCKVGVSHLLT